MFGQPRVRAFVQACGATHGGGPFLFRSLASLACVWATCLDPLSCAMGASAGPRITKIGGGGAVEASFPDEDVPTWLRGDGVVSLAWGCFVSAYLLWPLLAGGLVWFFWRVTLVKGGTLLGVLLYLPSFFDGSERRLGRPLPALRRSPAWRSSWRYLKLRLVRETPLPAEGARYIFGFHPHGILLMSRVCGYGGAWEALFPGVECRVLAASPMFKVPLVRDICLALGAVDAGRKTALRVLEKGLSVHVYPGGSKEVFMTDPADHDRVFLSGRKGFVNLALTTGSSLVPVYVFSEKHLYHRKLPSERLRLFLLRLLKFPVLLFYGRFYTLLPLKARPEGLLVAVGKPIPVERVAEPTPAQVEALHARYTKELKALFERWRGPAGYDASEQLIID